MTEQEIATKKGTMWVVFGVGVAALIAVWLLPSEGGVLESLVPLVFIGIFMICMVIAGRIGRKLKAEGALK